MNKSSFLRFALGLTLSATCLIPSIAHAEKTTELGTAMEDMNSAFRRLSRQVKDSAANADSLERVAIIKKTSEASLALIPEMAADQPADKRAKFVEAYRTKMQEFIQVVEKLDSALRNNDNVKATALVEELKEQRNQSHKAYKKPKAE